MTILGLLIFLLVLALILPGVSLDPKIMRIVMVLIVVAIIVWLFTGSGLLRA